MPYMDIAGYINTASIQAVVFYVRVLTYTNTVLAHSFLRSLLALSHMGVYRCFRVKLLAYARGGQQHMNEYA